MVGCAGAAVAAAAASAGGCVSSNNPSTSSDSGTPDLDTGTLPTGQDSGTDSTVPPVDAGPDTSTPVDSGPGIDAGCAPRAITGFVPPPYVHGTGEGFACNVLSPEPTILANDCFGDASTYSTCNSFASTGNDDAAVSAQCLSCLISPEGSDAGYGGMIQSVVLVPNLAGCIEGVDQTDAGLSCAMAIQAAWECAEFACKTACPVSDEASQEAYIHCNGEAEGTVCAAYTTAAANCIAAEQAAFDEAGTNPNGAGAMNAFCFGGSTPATQAADIAAYFCAS
jgi:hypothetical protein